MKKKNAQQHSSVLSETIVFGPTRLSSEPIIK